jgi:hypothetical protein
MLRPPDHVLANAKNWDQPLPLTPITMAPRPLRKGANSGLRSGEILINSVLPLGASKLVLEFLTYCQEGGQRYARFAYSNFVSGIAAGHRMR